VPRSRRRWRGRAVRTTIPPGRDGMLAPAARTGHGSVEERVRGRTSAAALSRRD
jgi:hypothetical protein